MRQFLSVCPVRRQPTLTSGVPAAASEALAGGTKVEVDGDESERICRYCFEGSEGGDLISPCLCSGGQKYVHLTCLRMWQRAVLVSQPTHPDLYSVDSRQRVCNVCKAEFTCPPPTRTELMASITGPEIAALIDEGCLIASARGFSEELEASTADYPEVLRESVVDRNWIRGVFLITKVTEDRKRESVMLQLGDAEDLQLFLEQLNEDARTLHLRGRTFFVQLRALSDDAGPQARREAFQALRTPVTLRLRPEQAGDCGEDGVHAVNLARHIDLATTRTPRRAHRQALYTAAQQQALESGCAPHFQVHHFISGPCEDERVSACLVLTRDRFSVIQGTPSGDCLEDGIREAQRVAREEQTTSDVEPHLADSAAPLLVEAAVERAESSGSDEPQRKCPRTSLQAPPLLVTSPVRLYVCWGYAGWSRCQLMGEIARQSWGLCRSLPQDVLATSVSALWDAVYPRLLFAPKNELSEHHEGEAQEAQERRRQLRHMSVFHEILRGNLPTGSDADMALEVLREVDEESDDVDEESDVADEIGERISSSESSSSDGSSS